MALPLAAPALIAAVVGTVCLLLALASWRAMLRTGNRGIYFVIAAFLVMATKGFAKSFTLSAGAETPDAELVFSLFDLAAVGLFAWPLLRRLGVVA